MPDCKDGSGLTVIEFDFVTGGQEMKFDILVEFHSFSRYFVSWSSLPVSR